MAKKPSPAELKKAGEELSKQLGDIRKKQHNFAMQIGKDGIVFHIDRKKPADVMWRNAKKDGGGPKGAKGRITMKGKILELDCDDPDSVPGNLLKLAKKHFAERGQPLRILLKGIEEEDDEAVEEKTTRRRTSDTDEIPEPAAREQQSQSAEVEEAPTPTTEEPEPTQETLAETPEAGHEINGGASNDDVLREGLQKEFDALQPDIEAAAQSGNKGVVKKVDGLKNMFEAQVTADAKKANSILSVLKNTLTSAKKAGHIVAPAESGVDPLMVERRSKLAELEKGVDELLAEFA